MDRLPFEKTEDLFVPEGIADNFLAGEDGSTDKILVFTSKLCKRIVERGEKMYFYGDGTFKYVTRSFCQLYTIHLDLGSDENTTNIVPSRCILSPSGQDSSHIYATI